MMEHPDANQTQSDGANSTEEVNPFPYPNYPFPKLDVCTVEVPVQEAASYFNKVLTYLRESWKRIKNVHE